MQAGTKALQVLKNAAKESWLLACPFYLLTWFFPPFDFRQYLGTMWGAMFCICVAGAGARIIYNNLKEVSQ